jgi:hypothetical protein
MPDRSKSFINSTARPNLSEHREEVVLLCKREESTIFLDINAKKKRFGGGGGKGS